MKKIVLLFLLIVLGCSSVSAQRVNYKNDKNATLLVENHLNDNIILFAGAVNKRNLIGGVRAAGDKYVAIRDRVQGNSGIVLLRAVKEDVFKKKKYNLDEEDVVFAKMVVFNKDTPQDGKITINGSSGGEHGLYIENNSPFALEIRLNNINGPVLTTFSPHERARIVTMDPNPAGYKFYPTYVYYDARTGQLSSIQPSSEASGQTRRPLDLNQRRSMQLIRFNGPSDDDLPIQPAYLTIVNQTGTEIAKLFNGGANLYSQKGYLALNPGETDTYEMDIQPASKDSMTFGTLEIDRDRGEAYIIQVEGLNGNPRPTLKRGVDYILYYIDNGGKFETVLEEGKERSFDPKATFQLLNE